MRISQFARHLAHLATPEWSRPRDAVRLTILSLTVIVSLALAAILVDGAVTGTITASTTVSLLVAVLTLSYVVLTYLLLRQQRDDRHQAALPFLWCHARLEGQAVALTVENSSAVPAIRLTILAHILAQGSHSADSQDQNQAESREMLFRRDFGGLPPGYGVCTVLELPAARELYLFLLFETHIGHACAGYFWLSRFAEENTYEPLEAQVSLAAYPGGRRSEPQSYADLFQDLASFQMPKYIHRTREQLQQAYQNKRIETERYDVRNPQSRGSFFVLSPNDSRHRPSQDNLKDPGGP